MGGSKSSEMPGLQGGTSANCALSEVIPRNPDLGEDFRESSKAPFRLFDPSTQSKVEALGKFMVEGGCSHGADSLYIHSQTTYSLVYGTAMHSMLRLPELMARLQEEQVSLTGEQALEVAAALGKTEEPYFFRFEDLNSEAFDKKLTDIEAQNALKAKAEAEARRRAEAAAEAAQRAQRTQGAAGSPQAQTTGQEAIDDDLSG